MLTLEHKLERLENYIKLLDTEKPGHFNLPVSYFYVLHNYLRVEEYIPIEVAEANLEMGEHLTENELPVCSTPKEATDVFETLYMEDHPVRISSRYLEGVPGISKILKLGTDKGLDINRNFVNFDFLMEEAIDRMEEEIGSTEEGKEKLNKYFFDDTTYKGKLEMLQSYPSYRPDNSEEDEEDLEWYDFLEVANGNIDYALSLRERVEWQHPSTLVEEDKNSDEYKEIYFLELWRGVEMKLPIPVQDIGELEDLLERSKNGDTEEKNTFIGVLVHHTGEIEVRDLM